MPGNKVSNAPENNSFAFEIKEEYVEAREKQVRDWIAG